MQDATRIREQVDEMTMRAEANADLAKENQKLVSDRKKMAHRETQKMRFMKDVFSIGIEALQNRKKALQEATDTPPDLVFDALEDALTNVTNLIDQVQRQITHNEGASAALEALEITFEKKAQDATSRVRGMAVQGKRAIGVAEGRNVSKTPPEAPEAAQNEPLFSSTGSVTTVSGSLES